MFTSLLLLISFPLTFSETLVWEETYNNGGEDFDFAIWINESITTVQIEGPADVWLAVGFGARQMRDTYTIAYGKTSNSGNIELHERQLNGRDEGDVLTPCNSGTEYCVRLLNATTNNSRLTVWFERDNVPDTTDDVVFEFSNEFESLDLIWAYGDDSDVVNEAGEHPGNGKSPETISWSYVVFVFFVFYVLFL